MKKQNKKTIRAYPKKMTAAIEEKSKKNEYEKDFFNWTEHQALFLQKKDFSKIDIENLIEEIRSLGQSEYDKLESHLMILLQHLLKIKYQPTLHSRSWDLSVKGSARNFQKTLKRNPGLKSKLDEILEDAYFNARLEAAKDTGLDEDTFPENSPWTIKEILKNYCNS